MFRMFRTDRQRRILGAAAAMALFSPAGGLARAGGLPVKHAMAAPSTAEFMRVMDLRLQTLRPRDIHLRTILFDQIVPGKPHDGRYPFVVSLTIHDYSAGWPTNNYFGKTCVSKLEKGTFVMQLTVSHDWTVEGPITLAEPLCRPNPAESVSAFPLAELPGKRVPKGTPPSEVPKSRSAGVLMSGEYACSQASGRLMANMGFRIKLDRTYTDLNGANGGKYIVNAVAGTIAFRGGFLDGRIGKDLELTRFVFPTLVCQRWQ